MLCYGYVRSSYVRSFVHIYYDTSMYVRLGGHWLGKVRWGKVRLTFVR